MMQVGWGRRSRPGLNDLMQMNTQFHDFILRTPYTAQVGASHLAARIRDTILSTASGKPTPNELGDPKDRFILLVGHDSNLSWLGGLSILIGFRPIRRLTRLLPEVRSSSRFDAAG